MRKLVVLAGIALAGPAAEARTLEGEWRGEGPRTVFCEAGWGAIRVRVGEESTVSARVTLEARDGSSAGARALAAGRLRLIERGDEVRVFFEDVEETRAEGELTGALKSRGYQETWELTVPTSFAVQLGLERGAVDVEGISGGVHVETGIGEVVLDLPAGDVHLELGEGEATVRLARDDVGAVIVHSPQKEPELRVGAQREPWSHRDEAYHYRGDGPSEIQLETFSAAIRVELR